MIWRRMKCSHLFREASISQRCFMADTWPGMGGVSLPSPSESWLVTMGSEVVWEAEGGESTLDNMATAWDCLHSSRIGMISRNSGRSWVSDWRGLTWKTLLGQVGWFRQIQFDSLQYWNSVPVTSQDLIYMCIFLFSQFIYCRLEDFTSVSKLHDQRSIIGLLIMSDTVSIFYAL